MPEVDGSRPDGGADGSAAGAREREPAPTWQVAAIAWVAATFIRLLRATCRLSFVDDAAIRDRERRGERFVLAFWHRHLLFMPYAYRGERISVLISASRDGELIARTVAHLGIDSSRGSTSRGAVAGLRDLLRKARQGFDLAFTPDGPRGPASRVQPGVLMTAAATGWPIQPVAIAARPAKRLASWDRFLVPVPFARVAIVYGQALEVPRGADLEPYARELEARLDAAEAEAERRAAGRRPVFEEETRR